MNLPVGSLRYAGGDGFSWSAAAYSGTDAYRLLFDDTSAYPSNNLYRDYGFPIRCVAL